MSTFAVTREHIGEIRPIKNADRIEIATLQGMDFQFVVGKGVYQPGQEVLYFPVDSVLPPYLIDILGLEKKLAGKEQNRIKTVVLRGAISQGVVAPTSIVRQELKDITLMLGVTKWDPPPNEVKNGILVHRPEGQSMYDSESADRYTAIVESMLDEPVFITEKLEGTNAWATAWPPSERSPEGGDGLGQQGAEGGARGELAIGMRDNRILEKPDRVNPFHLVLKAYDVDAFAHELARHYKSRVTVYGEHTGPGCGVSNYYALETPSIRLFDIRVGLSWLPPVEFLEQVHAFFGEQAAQVLVPILVHPSDRVTLRAWLAGRSVKEASNGPSVIVPLKRREGIVIKPLTEGRDDAIGRRVLKQRSPLYLANTDF